MINKRVYKRRLLITAVNVPLALSTVTILHIMECLGLFVWPLPGSFGS
jgi:uncharacterized membrane protein